MEFGLGIIPDDLLCLLILTCYQARNHQNDFEAENNSKLSFELKTQADSLR